MGRVMPTRRIRWIAERALTDEAGDSLKASLGAPEQVSAGEWRCAFRLARGRSGEVQYGRGIDGVQALIQAVAGLRAAIDKLGVAVQWEGSSELGASGFPMFVPYAFGLELSRTIERMVDTEVQRFVQAARAGKKRP